MFITNQQIKRRIMQRYNIVIAKGQKCVPADNMPEGHEIKYWLDEMPEQFDNEEAVESYMRNYGIGLTENEVVKI